ncbi:MAG: TonB-dependent receptor, partial [Candidatus Omnitrophica bacterium]|nr:TonB-dependent receptor [Candidatus Omnitrophota bacterium]
YNDQDVISDNYDALTGVQNSSTVNNNVYQGISLNGSLKLREEDLFVFGSDFDWHRFKSSNYLDTGKSISMQSPYANYTLKLNNWDFIPGVRFDNNQQFGSQTSPSFGIIYHFKDPNRSLVRAKISRAFNAPPLMWIYNNLPPYVNPNLDLKAERAIVYEIGFETKLFSSTKMKLDLYRSDVKDAIAYNNSEFMMDNFRKLRRQGAELSLNYKVNDDLSFYGSGAFNDVENRETKQTVRDSGIARQSFNLGGKYENDKGFGVDLYGYYNRWSSDPDQANDRKFIFDAKFKQEFKDINENVDFELFFNIYNLANSKYWSDPTYSLPKRYFEGGFSLNF